MAKVILDGGWIFDEATLKEIMGITGIDIVNKEYKTNIIRSMKEKVLWRPPIKTA